MQLTTNWRIMVIVVAVFSLGWIWPTGPARAEEVPFKVTKLIGDLNDASEPASKAGETRKKAKEELTEMGKVAVEGLVKEVDDYFDLEQSHLLSAARCLAVLREIGAPEAVVIATEILKMEPLPQGTAGQRDRMVRAILLTEASAYLAANADNEKARDALLEFIGGDPIAAGWLGRGNMLQVNVFRALRSLVNSKNDKVNGESGDVNRKNDELGERLSLILPKLPYKLAGYDDGSLYLPHLQEDDLGVVWQLRRDKKTNIEYRNPRLACMDWLGQLDYRKAKPEIEKGLRSERKEERDLALKVLEGFTKETANGDEE